MKKGKMLGRGDMTAYDKGGGWRVGTVRVWCAQESEGIERGFVLFASKDKGEVQRWMKKTDRGECLLLTRRFFIRNWRKTGY